MLSNPIKISLGVIGALTVILMVVAIMPINMWCTGTGKLSIDGQDNDAEFNFGLFEMDISLGGQTITYKYA